MTEQRQCPQCGAELSADAAGGLCPKCLLDAGFESRPAVAPTIDEPPPSHPATAETVPPSEPSSGRFRAPLLESLARQFPQLEILEHLGQGGMGVVYKARQKQLNRLVAVKILPPRVADDPAFAERFAREAQALAKLNHQNIVQVYDFGRTDEFFYFVMEYVDGVNLRALIGDGKLQPDEALRIVPQICEALQFAHDEGIVHRDIKPENILIDKRGRVKIADFGLAKLLGHAPEDLSLTGTGQLMGTLGYMAPEQLQQAHTVDHRADIFSLGVVFYEMLTGQLPMGRFEPPSKKVHIDVRLDEVVLRTLESEPDRRYQHASDVKTDVEAVAGTQQRVYAPLFSQKSATVAGEQPLSPVQLQIPAIGLIVVGALHAACLLLVGVALWRIGLRELLLLPVPVTVGVLILVGGAKMLRLQSHGWAVAASILALLPCGPAWLLGLPMGIWSLVALGLPEVKRAFAAKRAEPTATLDASGAQSADARSALYHVKGPAIGLLVAGVLSFASPVAFAAIVILDKLAISDGPGNADQRQIGTMLAWGFAVASMYAIVALPLPVIVMAGALCMKKLLARWLALTAGVIAVLPLSIAWPVTLPLGIWALVVLNRQAVEAAFAAQTIDAHVLAPRIRRLGQWLRWTGLVGLALDGVWALLIAGGMWNDMQYARSVSTQQVSPYGAEFAPVRYSIAPFVISLCVAIAVLSVGILFVRAARKMRALQSFGAAVTAGILALVPISPAWPISFPLGLWTLALLSSRDARRVFSGATKSVGDNRAGTPTEVPQMQRIGKLALVLCLGGVLVAGAIALVIPYADELVLYPAIFVFAVSQLAALTLGIIARRDALGRAAAVVSGSLLLIGLVLLLMLPISPESTGPINALTAEGTGKTRFEIPDPADRPADVPRETPSESISRMWVFGTDGPKLNDSHARTLLKPSQVNKVLQESFQEYLTLEAQHRQQTTDAQGHMITSIQPLSKTDLETVENHLWSKLDPILDKEQQNIFRLNLELYPPPVAGGMFLRDIVRPGLFGWGEQGARVEIWREGTWFRWKVLTTHYEDESRAAELPADYARFWKEAAAK